MQRFVKKNCGLSMKISGCTFVRNGFLLGYPVKESLQSLHSICDEVVIAVGNSEDDTLKYVQSLDNPKIESETTIMKDRAKRGLTWIVKQSKSENVFIGSNFSMSFKLEKILVGVNS